MGPSSSLKREVFFHSFSYGRSSHFLSVGYYCFDFSSIRRELIDSCCYLRGFNAPVASHVFFSVDFSLAVVVNVWALSGPFSPSYWLICVLLSVTNVLVMMFKFVFYAPQLWGMLSPAAISRVIRSSLPLALSPMSLTKMWSFKCSVSILPLHRRSTRSRSLDGATVAGRPPLLLISTGKMVMF
jgi:hypothetical protein